MIKIGDLACYLSLDGRTRYAIIIKVESSPFRSTRHWGFWRDSPDKAIEAYNDSLPRIMNMKAKPTIFDRPTYTINKVIKLELNWRKMYDNFL